MQNIRLILAPGFALSHSYFNTLTAELTEYRCLDHITYQKLPSTSQKQYFNIGIGHSLGFRTLLAYPLDYYIGIAAFINFHNQAMLTKTIASFLQNPEKTIQDFHHNMGDHNKSQAESTAINFNAMLQDLNELQKPVAIDKLKVLFKRMHIILPSHDNIINSKRTIQELVNLQIDHSIIQHTQHNLGYAKAKETAQLIRQKIHDISSNHR